jgi:hypothetical protein
MEQSERRKRRRKPTLTPRFLNDSIALEIALIRSSLDILKDLDKKNRDQK